MEIDVERCTGCKLCQLVCSVVNFRDNNPKKSGIRIVSRLFTEGRYDVIVCNQCGQCVEACPAGAIRAERGVVTIDAEQCVNCGACIEACPLGAIFVHPEVEHPIKCVACGECERLCPRGALRGLAASSYGKGVAS